MDLKTKYAACSHLSKEQPKVAINKELRESLTTNCRVLPVYEKALTDYEFCKTHSLQTNKYLKCRWQEYQTINISAKPEPYVFPSVRDCHYYKFDARYAPDQSIKARPNNRFCLKMGPGVDKFGEMPLPSDVGHQKTAKNVHKKIIKPKTKPKVKFLKR